MRAYLPSKKHTGASFQVHSQPAYVGRLSSVIAPHEGKRTRGRRIFNIVIDEFHGPSYHPRAGTNCASFARPTARHRIVSKWNRDQMPREAVAIRSRSCTVRFSTTSVTSSDGPKVKKCLSLPSVKNLKLGRRRRI